MSNNDDRFIFDKLLNGLLHLIFVLRIGKSSRLVKHQNRSIFKNGSCHTNPLGLTAGQIHAFVTDPRMIAVRQTLYKIVTLSRTGSFDHLFTGSRRITDPNILIERIKEEKAVLKNKGNEIHQILGRYLFYINSANADLPFTDIPKARNQVGYRRLSGT